MLVAILVNANGIFSRCVRFFLT